MSTSRKFVVKSDYVKGDTIGPYKTPNNNEHLVHTGSIYADQFIAKNFIFGNESIMPHMEMWITAAADTSLTQNIWKKVEGGTETTYAVAFSMSADNRAEYTASLANVHFTVFSSFSISSSTVNTIFDFAIAKNGIIQSASHGKASIGTGTDFHRCSIINLTQMTTNDFIELWMKASKNTTLNVSTMNWVIIRV